MQILQKESKYYDAQVSIGIVQANHSQSKANRVQVSIGGVKGHVCYDRYDKVIGHLRTVGL